MLVQFLLLLCGYGTVGMCVMYITPCFCNLTVVLTLTGMHKGSVQKLDDGAVCVTLEWDEPLGGVGTDVFYTVRDDLLYVDSTMLTQGRLVKYRTIYNKLKQ